MKDLQEKYARVILKTCLKIKKNQPLVINADQERTDFVRILANVAYEEGVKDIYFDLYDSYLKHDALVNLDTDDLKKMSFWNKEKWNEYAEKGAAFIMLSSQTPGLMKDVDPKKLNDLTMHAFETRARFDELRDKACVPWCIAAVPTLSWAKKIFKDAKDPEKKLWNQIFKICHINEDNPESYWNKQIEKLNKRSEKLNNYHFKSLKYTNSLGTDFLVELPEKHIWASGRSSLENGTDILVNFPTEEVFTSPTYDSANGVLYASKPLCYQDNLIEDFWIEFKNGKVTDCYAKKGEDTLRQLINSCKNSNRLGEVALVEYDSSISKSSIIFYETLYDENAACHLALGASFPECIENGNKMSKEELEKNKMNNCQNHVDFMVGTKDLKIIGYTENEEIVIFENGNFTSEFA